jgi:exonuclease III
MSTKELIQIAKEAKKYEVKNKCEKRDITINGIPKIYKSIPQLNDIIKKLDSNKPISQDDDASGFINVDDKKWKLRKSIKKVISSKLDIITIPKSYTFVKGFNSFITPSLEDNYNKNTPKPNALWFSSRPMYGLIYAIELNGGLNVYKASKDINLAVTNASFINTFFKALELIHKNNPTNTIYKDMIPLYKLGFGHDISFKERSTMLAFAKPFGIYMEEWDTMCFDYKEYPWIIENYDYKDIGSLQRMRGIRTVIYKYLIMPILLYMGIDGVIVPQHKNPFIVHGGIFAQEIIFHSYNDCMVRDVNDPLDWTNWKELRKELPELFPNGFSVNYKLDKRNRDFHMIKWFFNQKKLEKELLDSSVFINNFVKTDESKTLSICTLNVLDFQSIDGTITVPVNISNVSNFAKKLNVDIICLQEVRKKNIDLLVQEMRSAGYLHNSKMNQSFGNIIFTKLYSKSHLIKEKIIRKVDETNGSKHASTVVYYPLQVNNLKIATTHLSRGKRYYDILNKAVKEKTIKDNNNYRVEEGRRILDTSDDIRPDIILGDFNAVLSDPVIKYFYKEGYKTDNTNVKETNTFGTIVDHILLSKLFIDKYDSWKILSYPYVWSDHNAVILLIDNFF